MTSLRTPLLWLGCALLLCLLSPRSAAAQTYAEVLAECVTLFTPLVSVEQAQRFVPEHPLGEGPDVHGNSDECWVEFKEKDWAPNKPGSATPLLQFTLAHGEGHARKYAQSDKMASQIAKKTYATVDPGTLNGVKKAFRYTGFGRHILTMQVGDNTLTVQILDQYPLETLESFATLVLEATATPALRAWRERK